LEKKNYLLRFKELISFIKSPQRNIASDYNIKNKIKDTFFFFTLKFSLVITVGIILTFFLDLNNIGLQKMKSNSSLWNLIVIGAFLIPLLEELTFRLCLVFKPILLAISSAMFFYVYGGKAIFGTGYSNFGEETPLKIVLSIVFGLFFYLISTKFNKIIHGMWDRNFRWIYYFSIILFSFLHITNYELTLKNIMLIPMITLPQTISGAFTGYIRLRHGFQYGFFMHSLNNLIAFSIVSLN
jgi:hypothetical protein